MTAYREHSVRTADGLTLFVRDYDTAPSGALPVLCLPGLTRNHRDFTALAERLAPRRRVLCPDMRGRGRSDRDPEGAGYIIPAETQDVIGMLDALAVSRVAVIGSSRGGLSAMVMGVLRPDLLAAAVLVDVGPRLERAGLERIVATVSPAGSYADWTAAARAVQAANGTQLPGLDEADWLAFARRVMVERDGTVVPDHDPRIVAGARAALAAELPELWEAFDAMAAMPVLAIRGGLSDILSAETLAEMQRRMPGLRSLTLPGRGHVPLLDEPPAVAAIVALLDEADRQCTQT